MSEQVCRRELLRRSVLISGAVAASAAGWGTSAVSAQGRWDVPPVPGDGELIGASVDESSSTLFVAVAAGPVTRIHSIPIGGTSWSTVNVESTGRADLAFCVASDGTLVLAGAAVEPTGTREIGVHVDETGLPDAPRLVDDAGRIVTVEDNAKIVVEDRTRRPAARTSADGGRTWTPLDVTVGAANAWFAQVAPYPGRPGVVALFGVANSEPGLLEGITTFGSAAAVADRRVVSGLPELPDLAEGAWTAAVADGDDLVVAAAETSRSRLLRLDGSRWSPIATPPGGRFSSPVALSLDGGELLVATLDGLGRPNLWRTPSLRSPSWERRAIPMGVAVGSHPRSIVEPARTGPVVFGTDERSPVVAAGRS